jgi:hypothetical protein
MSNLVYKPYAVISKEWAVICGKYTIAGDNLMSAKNPFMSEYPSDQVWEKYSAAVKAFEEASKEMEEYRRVVRIAD